MNTSLIDVHYLHQHLSDPDLILLDASPVANKSNLSTKFEGMQIKGSRFFDLKNTFRDFNSDMPNTLPTPVDFEKACQELGINASSKIVVYDNLGIYTSPRVWWMFRAMGHTQVAVLDGGLPEWAAQGHKLEPSHQSNYTAGNFSAQANPTLKKDMTDIVENIDSQTALVLDARSAGRFCGTAPEPRAHLSSGHMPHAISLPFTEVLDHGKMKPVSELEIIFSNLNIGNKPLIFSCGSGLTACIILLAAELVLDNPMAIYDGSWTEWATNQSELIQKEVDS